MNGTGSTFDLQVESGNLNAGNITTTGATNIIANGSTVLTKGDVITCGPLTAGSGDLKLQSVGANVQIDNNVTASNGSLTLTSVATGSVTVAPLTTAKASAATNVNTNTLNDNGTLQSGTGNLTIQGTGAANALVVNLGAGSLVQSTGAHVNFNTPGAQGTITMIGGNGDIKAGGATPLVVLNGGSNAVSVDVNSINCCVNGTGSTFDLQVESGNLNAGNITTTGATNIIANGSTALTKGDVLTCGPITAFGGDVKLQSTAANVQINNDVTASNGSLTLTSASTGSVTIAPLTTAKSSAATNVNTNTLNENGTLQSGTGDLTIQGTGAANALVVNLGAGSLVQSIGANVNFNTSGAQGTITMTGGNGDIKAGGATPLVILNGGSNAVSVDVNSINCCVNGTGSTFDLQVESGNLNAGNITTTGATNIIANGSTALTKGDVLTCGPITATSGDLKVQSTGANVQINNNVTAGNGSLTLSSAPIGSVTIAPLTTAKASATNVNTNTLNENGTLQSGSGNLIIQGTGAANALVVNLGPGALLQSTGANVNFNTPGAQGSITMIGGKGDIKAGGASPLVILNGGANAVAVDVNTINCCVNGTGSTFDLQVESGNLNAGNITTTGATNIIANGSTVLTKGDVITCGPLTAGSGDLKLQSVGANVQIDNNVTASNGSLTLTSVATGSVTVAPLTTAKASAATNVNTNTLNDNGTLQSGTGNLTIQGTGAANALVVNLGAGSLVQSTGAHVNFNTPGAQGTITMIGGNGDIKAGGATPLVVLNGGSNAVSVDVNSINCCVNGTGSTFDLQVESGNLNAGNITTTGATNIIANGSTALTKGDVLTCGPITAFGGDVKLQSTAANVQINNDVTASNGSLTLTSASTGSVTIAPLTTAKSSAATNVNTNTLNENGTLQSGTGDLTIQGTGAANALVVNLGAGSLVQSIGANVNFNTSGAQGTITMTGGNGDIKAGGATPLVILNGGSNAVSVDVNSINCCVNGTGSTFDLQVESGNLNAGNITTTGATNIIANGSTALTKGDVLTCGPITATSGDLKVQSTGANVQINNNVTAGNGSLTLSSAPIGSVTIAPLTTAKASATNVNTNTLNENGTLQSGSGNLIIQGTGAANALVVNLGPGALLQSTGANVNFNTPGAQGSITMIGGKGDIKAGGVSPLVILNGGANAVAVDVNSINCCVNGTGSTFDLQVESGNLNAGNIVTSGATNIIANGSTALSKGDVLTCGPITAFNGDVRLQSVGANVQINNDVTASNGSLTLTSAPTGSVTIAPLTTAKASAATNVNTNTLNENGALQSGTGNLSIQGTGAANALVVNLGAGSLIQSTGANVNFDSPGAQGAITMIGGKGDIKAGGASPLVILNGGSKAVSVDVNSINCCVNGTGSTFDLQVESGNLSAGNISTTGATNIIANGSTALTKGDVLTCGPITATSGDLKLQSVGANIQINNNVTASNGSLTLTSAPTGSVTIAPLTTAKASAATTVNTNTLNENGTLQSGTSDLTIQGTGTANALIVNLGAGSLVQSTGANVNFNSPVAQGTITMIGGNGDIKAGGASPLVILNGGSNAVSVDVNSINCCVNGTGSTFDLQIESGNLNAGNITTTGKTTIAAVNGDVLTCGPITSTNGPIELQAQPGGNITINASITTAGLVSLNGDKTVTLASGTISGGTVSIGTSNLIDNGIIQATANNGKVDVQSPTGGLTVSMGPVSEIDASAPGGTINFNFTTPGKVNITGGPNNGLISANTVVRIYGGGGSATADVNQIIGCVDVNGSAIQLTTQAGDINFCCAAPIDTSSGTGAGGAVTVAANGGSVIGLPSITTSGTGGGGAVSITAGNGNVSVGPITSNGNGGSNGGTIFLNATGTIIGGALTATSGTGDGGSVSTTSSELQLTGGIDVSAPGGKGGMVVVTTTGPSVLSIGSNAGSNFLNGGINGSGVSGGVINLINNNQTGKNFNIAGAATITTDATTGTAGNIQFRTLNLGTTPLGVFNAGKISTIDTGGTTGRVGFNGGPLQDISLICIGCITAGEFISFGNLNTTTLQPIPNDPGGIITIVGGCIKGDIIFNGTLYVPPISESGAASNVTVSKGGISLANLDLSPASVEQLPATDLTPRSVGLNQPLQGSVSSLGLAGHEDEDGTQRDYIPGARTFSHTFDSQEVNRLSALRVFSGPGTKSGVFDLQFGNCVFAPDENITVITPLGKIYIPGGSIAFVMNSGGEVAVYDLHDGPGPDVRVVVGGKKHVDLIKPGDFAVMTSSNPKQFKDLVGYMRWIAYRKTRGPGQEQDIKVFAGEFSLPSALTEVVPLRQMRASRVSLDKQAADKILKDAVILLRISGGGSAYHSDHQRGDELQPQSLLPDDKINNLKKSQQSEGKSRFFAYSGNN